MAPASLPGELFETYAFYKKGTIAFIRWLSEQSGEAKERASVNSVDELRYLAKKVISKHIEIPTSLLSDLRETVRARTFVSKFFKSLAKPGDRDICSSHEHFTTTLQQIYRDFLALTPKSPKSPATAPTTPTKRSKLPANVFECLSSDEGVGSEDDCSVVEQCEARSGSVPKCSRAKKSKKTGNDNIGDFMALALYLSQLDQLMLTVKETWEKLARGEIPIVVAAATTSMAYQAARALEKDLEQYQIYDPDQFLTKYTTCLHSLNLSGSSFDASKVPRELTPFREHKGPQLGWLALIEFKSFLKTARPLDLQWICSCKSCEAACNARRSRPIPCDDSIPCDDPMEFLAKTSSCTKQEEDQVDMDRRCLQLILKRMGQLSILKYAEPPLVVLVHTPLLADLEMFLGHDLNMPSKRTRYPMTLSFGLEMLVEGMKSYCQAFAGKKPVNCRVQSLQFATEFKKIITHLIHTPNAPCGCLEIGSFHVAKLLKTERNVLEHFISTMRFDMFHLSPWVSGMHMAEFLVLSAEIGAHSWHHAYYVGTTFYIYQTLIALEVIKSTDFPVMERLCDLFKDTVFLGQRPLRNLLSCYQRWSGGTLSFPKGHCDTTNRMHNHSSGTGKKWTMKYVRDASQGGNHPHRGFNPMKISLLVLLARRNFVLDDDVLAWVHCSKPWPKASKKDRQKARTQRDGHSFIARSVEAAQEKLLEEFRGDFPVAKINYIAIYELCVEILEQIHKAEHPTQDPSHICSCVAARLLGAADQHLDDMRLIKAYQECSLLKHCKEGFEKTLQDKCIADFVLDI